MANNPNKAKIPELAGRSGDVDNSENPNCKDGDEMPAYLADYLGRLAGKHSARWGDPTEQGSTGHCIRDTDLLKHRNPDRNYDA